ncbi:MAG: calcium-binding protein [Hyphomicrobiales bacterium]
MATYKVTAADTTMSGPAIVHTEAAASSFTLDSGASVAGADDMITLSGAADWTVAINGHSVGNYTGLWVTNSVGSAKISIGAEASIGTVLTGTAVLLSRQATIDNKGTIFSLGTGVSAGGGSAETLTNSGVIAGGDYSVNLNGTTSNLLTNSGTLIGVVGFGSANSKFVNTGSVVHDSSSGVLQSFVNFSSGNDTLDNKGLIDSGILVYEGTNKVTNSGSIGQFLGYSVFAGNGADTITNTKTGTLDGSVYLGNGVNILTNDGTIGDNGFSVTGGTDVDTVKNTKTMTGNVALYAGNDVLINSGVIDGTVDLGANDDKFTTTGSVYGAVFLDEGNDTMDGKGYIEEFIDLGNGNNTLTFAGEIDGSNINGYGIAGGEGDDVVTLLKTAVVSGIHLGDGNNKFTNAGFIYADFSGFSLHTGTGSDTVKNTGVIRGIVDLSDGNDVFTNTGSIGGEIFLGFGDDQFTGGNGVETVWDDAGTDTIKLGGGNDFFVAQGGEGDFDDSVDGGTGEDLYDGSIVTNGVRINLDSANHAAAYGGPGGNTLKLTASNVSGTHVDTIKGFEDATGGVWGDAIFGSSVANKISGGLGNDELWGYAGNDVIHGDDGSDSIVGGQGADQLYGGADGDSFIYLTLADSGTTKAARDEIMDFEDGGFDKIDLSGIDADTRASAPNDQAFTSGLNSGTFTAGTAGQFRIYATATGWIIEGEVTGDGKADFSIAVRDLDHNISWDTDNFVL